MGKVLQKYRVGKHFDYEITEDAFTYRRNEEQIEEMADDGNGTRVKRRLEPILYGENGDRKHSFPTLLDDLATLTKNTVQVGEHITFDQISRPTDLQQRALDLLGVKPRL